MIGSLELDIRKALGALHPDGPLQFIKEEQAAKEAWARGERPVPDPVALLMALREKERAENAALKPPRGPSGAPHSQLQGTPGLEDGRGEPSTPLSGAGGSFLTPAPTPTGNAATLTGTDPRPRPNPADPRRAPQLPALHLLDPFLDLGVSLRPSHHPESKPMPPPEDPTRGRALTARDETLRRAHRQGVPAVPAPASVEPAITAVRAGGSAGAGPSSGKPGAPAAATATATASAAAAPGVRLSGREVKLEPEVADRPQCSDAWRLRRREAEWRLKWLELRMAELAEQEARCRAQLRAAAPDDPAAARALAEDAPTTQAAGRPVTRDPLKLFRTVGGVDNHPFFGPRDLGGQERLLELTRKQEAASSAVTRSMDGECAAILAARTFVAVRDLIGRVDAIRSKVEASLDRKTLTDPTTIPPPYGPFSLGKTKPTSFRPKPEKEKAEPGTARGERGAMPSRSGDSRSEDRTAPGPTPRSGGGGGAPNAMANKRRVLTQVSDMDDVVCPGLNTFTPKFVERVKPLDISIPPVREISEADLRQRRSVVEGIQAAVNGRAAAATAKSKPPRPRLTNYLDKLAPELRPWVEADSTSDEDTDDEMYADRHRELEAKERKRYEEFLKTQAERRGRGAKGGGGQHFFTGASPPNSPGYGAASSLPPSTGGRTPRSSGGAGKRIAGNRPARLTPPDGGAGEAPWLEGSNGTGTTPPGMNGQRTPTSALTRALQSPGSPAGQLRAAAATVQGTAQGTPGLYPADGGPPAKKMALEVTLPSPRTNGTTPTGAQQAFPGFSPLASPPASAKGNQDFSLPPPSQIPGFVNGTGGGGGGTGTGTGGKAGAAEAQRPT